jgi:hypothetical protein
MKNSASPIGFVAPVAHSSRFVVAVVGCAGAEDEPALQPVAGVLGVEPDHHPAGPTAVGEPLPLTGHQLDDGVLVDLMGLVEDDRAKLRREPPDGILQPDEVERGAVRQRNQSSPPDSFFLRIASISGGMTSSTIVFFVVSMIDVCRAGRSRS